MCQEPPLPPPLTTVSTADIALHGYFSCGCAEYAYFSCATSCTVHQYVESCRRGFVNLIDGCLRTAPPNTRPPVTGSMQDTLSRVLFHSRGTSYGHLDQPCSSCLRSKHREVVSSSVVGKHESFACIMPIIIIFSVILKHSLCRSWANEKLAIGLAVDFLHKSSPAAQHRAVNQFPILTFLLGKLTTYAVFC